MTIQANLDRLGIELPATSAPAAAYAMAAQSGDLVFLAGHIARRDGKPWIGTLGQTMRTDEGQAAARAVAVDLIATLNAHVNGDLERVVRIVKVMSLVKSTPEYAEQHLVTNGCSELLVEVFGERGKHARSAFGVASIPLGACVEIEAIVQVR